MSHQGPASVSVTCPPSVANATFTAALNGSAFSLAPYALPSAALHLGCDSWCVDLAPGLLLAVRAKYSSRHMLPGSDDGGSRCVPRETATRVSLLRLLSDFFLPTGFCWMPSAHRL